MAQVMGDGWVPAVTLDGRSTITNAHFQITEKWEGMYQCILGACGLKFCAQGSTPKEAFDGSLALIKKHIDALTEILDNV